MITDLENFATNEIIRNKLSGHVLVVESWNKILCCNDALKSKGSLNIKAGVAGASQYFDVKVWD